MSNSSLERQLIIYPNHRYFNMFIAHCFIKHYYKAKGSLRILEKFFDDTFTEYQQNELLKVYSEMTEEQKKYPGRFYVIEPKQEIAIVKG